MKNYRHRSNSRQKPDVSHRWSGRLLVVLAGILLGGLTTYSAAGQTRTIAATPASLSFGSLPLGSSKTLVVALKNTGNTSVTFSGDTISGAGIMAREMNGTTLAPGQNAIVAVTLTPKTAGSISGSVKFASNATNSPVTIGVTGDGIAVAAATLTATPASASFGSVPIGATKSETVQLKNTGTASVTISSATVSGTGFKLNGITTPLVLAGGATASATLSYAPTVAGYVASSVSIASNATNKTLTMAVSGTGVTATRTITATPTSLSFGNENVGSSKILPVTLKNTGNSSITLSGVTISGAGITATGGVSGSTLAPGLTATIDVIFAPKTAGAVSGSVKVASNATNSPVTIGVTGDGLAAAAATLTATPASASFGSVPIGTTNSQTIQLKNAGTASVTISSATVSGTGFQVKGISTPLVLTGGATANATLSYTPTVAGYVAGSVSIASNAANKTLTLTVNGTGVTATRTITATPASLSFGNENVGSSNTLPVALKNTGNSSITLSGVTISGTGITATGGVSGSTLAPGQTATVDVTFAPKTAGSISGTVKVADNATNVPVTIVVSGDGIAATTHSVALNWLASPSPGIVGYHVYRAIGTAAYAKLETSVVSGLKYTDTTVAAGTTYKYAVTAVNSGGAESGYSGAITTTVP